MNSRNQPPVTRPPGALDLPGRELVPRVVVIVLSFLVLSCDACQDAYLIVVLVHFPGVAGRRNARKLKMKRRGSR